MSGIDWEKTARFLWDVLDDIDTADDLAKDNHKLYRNLVRNHNARRWLISSSDGYKVTFKGTPPERELTDGMTTNSRGEGE